MMAIWVGLDRYSTEPLNTGIVLEYGAVAYGVA